MQRVKRDWAVTPAPKRGEVILRMGEILREKKQVSTMLYNVRFCAKKIKNKK